MLYVYVLNAQCSATRNATARNAMHRSIECSIVCCCVLCVLYICAEVQRVFLFYVYNKIYKRDDVRFGKCITDMDLLWHFFCFIYLDLNRHCFPFCLFDLWYCLNFRVLEILYCRALSIVYLAVYISVFHYWRVYSNLL